MERVKVIYAEMLNRRPEHSAFDSYPDWLHAACMDMRVRLSERGARDYAVAEVSTPDGWKEATPGDHITHQDGVLGVESAA